MKKYNIKVKGTTKDGNTIKLDMQPIEAETREDAFKIALEMVKKMKAFEGVNWENTLR